MVTLSLLSSLLNPFARKPCFNDEATLPEEPAESGEDNTETVLSDQTDSTNLPPISIILTAHDQASALQKNLPAIMEQDYAAGFEVIVVTAKSEDNTEDVLKQLNAEYPHLYITFIPDSSRYMSRKKLAITLGVKAAKNEWLALITPESHPATNQWLKRMAQQCIDSNNLVIGYSNFDKDLSKTYRRFERLQQQYYLLRESQKSTAYRTPGPNLFFRKSQFMHERGFEGNLKYIRGEYDFIVNKYAKRGKTGIETSKSSWLVVDAPTPKQWRNEHLFYMETRKHLLRKFRHRLWPYIDTFFLHLSFILPVAVIMCVLVFIGFFEWQENEQLLLSILALVAFVSLSLEYLLRMYFANKAIKRFETDIPTWLAPIYQLSMLYRHLINKIRYKLADKYDFICHKL